MVILKINSGNDRKVPKVGLGVQSNGQALIKVAN